MIEDSPVGIEAALKAGMGPYLYDPQSIHRPVVDEVIPFRAMNQLPELLSIRDRF